MKIKAVNGFGIFFVICCLLFVAEAQTKTAAKTSFLITPRKSVGAINAKTSEADLKRLYGSENVQTGEIGLGEGETMTGTIVFPDEPLKRIEILWKDNVKKRHPQSIHLSGGKSLWKTREGVTLGTSLKELERINGKAFAFSGFGWDYGGTVESWQNGNLTRDFGQGGRPVTIRLGEAAIDNVTNKEWLSVTGDRTFSSRNRVMRKLNPKIGQIIIEFP